MSNTKILFIAGTGRCGSTILEMVLGQLQNGTSVGELRYLWKRGVRENRLCGTGVPFMENTHWKQIIDHLYGCNIQAEISRYELLESSLRIRKMLGLKTARKLLRLKEIVSPYARELSRVITAAHEEFGTNLIIDSSKMPMHGFALAQIPDIDLRVIHLVRDRKAVVHSWNTSKFDKSKDGMMNTQSIWKASTEWVLINRWIERYLGDGSVPYLKVSYTEFAKAPVQSVNKILEFVGEDSSLNPLDKGVGISLLPTPSISGNPTRFLTGSTVIKEDNRWVTDMPYGKRFLSDISASTVKAMFFL